MDDIPGRLVREDEDTAWIGLSRPFRHRPLQNRPVVPACLEAEIVLRPAGLEIAQEQRELAFVGPGVDGVRIVAQRLIERRPRGVEPPEQLLCDAPGIEGLDIAGPQSDRRLEGAKGVKEEPLANQDLGLVQIGLRQGRIASQGLIEALDRGRQAPEVEEDDAAIVEKLRMARQMDQARLQRRQGFEGPVETVEEIGPIQDGLEIGRSQSQSFVPKEQGLLRTAGVAQDAAAGAQRLGVVGLELEGAVIGGNRRVTLA